MEKEVNTAPHHPHSPKGPGQTTSTCDLLSLSGETYKKTSGGPCSFKCKQGLQGRKRQGRQIDGEKDERGATQFHVHNFDVSFFYVSPVFRYASAVPSLKL